MAEFVAFDPKVEILGAAILPVIKALGDRALLAKYRLDKVAPDKWYRQQDYLSMFKEVAQPSVNAMMDLVAIGMKIPENAVFPPDIDSIETALNVLDVAYHTNHRNGEIGVYQAVKVADQHYKMVCRNPYPTDFDYGIIYGLVRRFCPPNTRFSVTVDETAPNRQKGADSTTYIVTWRSA